MVCVEREREIFGNSVHCTLCVCMYNSVCVCVSQGINSHGPQPEWDDPEPSLP